MILIVISKMQALAFFFLFWVLAVTNRSVSASLFRLPLMAFDELGRAVRKSPFEKPRGQLIIIMPARADKGRRGKPLKIPLFSTVRRDTGASTRPVAQPPSQAGRSIAANLRPSQSAR